MWSLLYIKMRMESNTEFEGIYELVMADPKNAYQNLLQQRGKVQAEYALDIMIRDHTLTDSETPDLDALYGSALELLMKNKDITRLKTLSKNAIKHGFYMYGEIAHDKAEEYASQPMKYGNVDIVPAKHQVRITKFGKRTARSHCNIHRRDTPNHVEKA